MVAAAKKHLLAISGLNITLVAGSFYFILMMLRVAQKAAAALSLIVVFSYVVIAGLGLPVERAGLMSAAFFVGILLEREHFFLNSFFLAFLILLLVNPQSLTSISFQLSFLSVFSLVFFLPRSFENWRWKDTLGRGLAVMIGTFPLIIFYFNIFSPIGILANLIAIPLFDLSLLMAFLALAFGKLHIIGPFIVQITAALLQGGMAWIQWLARVRWGYLFLASPSAVQLIVYYFLLILLLGLRFVSRPWISWTRSILIGGWLVAASSYFWPQPRPTFHLTLLSAGKNELAHVQFAAGGYWLVNTGRGFPSDQAQWIVSPYLRHYGINHLAGILVTDTSLKHAGGLKYLSNNFSLNYFLYPLGHSKNKIFLQDMKRSSFNQVLLRGGENIPIQGGGTIRILGIVKEQILLGISYRDWNFLFLPSLTEEVLEELKKHRDFLYETDALILPALKPAQSGNWQLFSALFDMTDPKVVSLPHSDAQLSQFLKDRDIPLLDLSVRGATTLSIGESRPFNIFQPFRSPPENSLHIHSFLGDSSTF